MEQAFDRSEGRSYVFWPVLLGYLRTIIPPSIVERPLAPSSVVGDIDDLISRPQIVVPGEGDRFWSRFKELAASMPPRGNLVPDAHGGYDRVP